jgi:hypothetical protein
MNDLTINELGIDKGSVLMADAAIKLQYIHIVRREVAVPYATDPQMTVVQLKTDPNILWHPDQPIDESKITGSWGETRYRWKCLIRYPFKEPKMIVVTGKVLRYGGVYGHSYTNSFGDYDPAYLSRRKAFRLWTGQLTESEMWHQPLFFCTNDLKLA